MMSYNAGVGLLGLIVSLSLLIILRVHLGITLLASALVMGFLSLGLYGTLNVLLSTLTSYQTLNLISITFLILVLINLYRESSYLSKLSERLRLLLKSSKSILIVVPAILGLLPVIGGALMSAPIVDVEGERLRLSSGRKIFINVWFRHIVMVVYPLNQAIILTAILTETNLWSIIIRQIPIAIFMALIGFLISFHGLDKGADSTLITDMNETISTRFEALIDFIKLFSPILIAIILALVFKIKLALAVLLGVLVLIYLVRPNLKMMSNIFRDKVLYLTLLVAFSAILLRNIAIACDVSTIIASTIPQDTIPHILLLILLPLFLSALVGLASSGVALAVPLLHGLLDISYKEASLIYISSYLGYLSSPTHLCLIVTAQYFKTHITKGHRYLVPASILTLIFTIILYYIWP